MHSNTIAVTASVVALVLLVIVAFYFVTMNQRKNCETILVFNSVSKPLPNENVACVYAYYEKNKTYKDNLAYFLRHGLFHNLHVFLVINGSCTVPLPTDTRVTVLRRENNGYDFGAWSHAVQTQWTQLRTYQHVFFMNTSVRGPHERFAGANWASPFLHLFTNPSVKLVGTSINMLDKKKALTLFPKEKLIAKYGDRPLYPHVQSCFFALEAEALAYLKSIHFFEPTETYVNFRDLILKKEVGLSMLLLQKNWNLNCILQRYKNHDYRTATENLNPSSADPYFENAYWGRSIHPREVIFFKNNRF